RAVHNPAGSALGIAFSKGRTRAFAFPGVPSEFRAMAEQELGSDMLVHDRRMHSLFVVGWAESLLKDRLAPVIERRDLHISILPS
ncbi:MAG TPA: competence protein, partial [Synergistaceae bacterium]|nr:competence protein [Synergistaceae bacterium]